MVKSFYEEIRKRKMNGEKLSPLESVIMCECATMEDRLAFHDRRCRLFLEDIDQQEASSTKQFSRFHDLLEQAQKSSQSAVWEAMNALPPRGLSVLRRNQRNRQAANVFVQMRQGLSPDEIAEKLGISSSAVRNEQRRLIRLYNNIVKEHHRHTADSNFQTLSTLLKGTYRSFQRMDTGCNSYCFFHRDQVIGTASAQILPNFPLIIQSDGLILSSCFNPENTVFPGVIREIIDVDNSAAPFARLIWKGMGIHHLQLNWDTGTVLIDILSEGEKHQFYQEERLIATILPMPLPQKLFDWEVRYCLQTHDQPITDQLAVMLLSFPLLRFL